MTPFNPRDWYWIIAGDDTHAWSSAANAYVGDWPEDQVTRIASGAELNDVLAVYGIRGPLVTADHVRAEAQRRIVAATGASDLNGCIVKQLNALMRATELAAKGADTWTAAEAIEAGRLQAPADKVKAIRAASNVMEPKPPADYADDHHWVLP